MYDYKEIMQYYDDGTKACDNVTTMQREVVMDAYNDAKEMIKNAINDFTTGLEIRVKSWTAEDYNKFMEYAKMDSSIDVERVLVISTAYERTHKGDKDNVLNMVKKSLLEMALSDLENINITAGM